MTHGCLPALLVLLAAGPPPTGEVALAPAPVRGAAELPIQALPAPPQVVVRETKRYGTVTIDHARHLALRVSCRRCHGPGPVSRIALTAQVAHERCVGCHEEGARGPVRCAECHVRSLAGEPAATERSAGPRAPGGAVAPAEPGPDAPAPAGETMETVTAAAAPGEAGREPARERADAARPPREVEVAAPLPAGPEPDAEPRAPPGRRTWRARRSVGSGPPGGATDAVGSVPNASAPEDPAQDIRSPNAGPAAPAPAVRSRPGARPTLLEVGLNAGAGLGGSLRLSSAEGMTTRSYGIERVAGPSSARMLMLVGFGVRRPLLPRVEATGSAVVGFDAQERPRLGFAPSLGARLGVDWRPPAGWLLRSVQLSVTCTLGFARDAIGAQTGGPRVFATLSAGLRPPSS